MTKELVAFSESTDAANNPVTVVTRAGEKGIVTAQVRSSGDGKADRQRALAASQPTQVKDSDHLTQVLKG